MEALIIIRKISILATNFYYTCNFIVCCVLSMSRQAVKTQINLSNITLIILLVITLINFTRSEDEDSTKVSVVVPHQNSINSNLHTELSVTSTLSEWWEKITSTLWKWLNDDQIESKSADGKEITEARTFAKLRRLQLALLPIMFKFGVLSTLITTLLFLALKSVFLLKALFVVNLAVIFGKFFTWKSDLLHGHQGGGGWGPNWGPPPHAYHSYPPPPPPVEYHSPPIIETPHSVSDDHKQIHVHVHTNKESHYQGGGGGGGGYYEPYGLPSEKKNALIDVTREGRNSPIDSTGNDAFKDDKKTSRSDSLQMHQGNQIYDQTETKFKLLPKNSQGLFVYSLRNGHGNFKLF